MPISEELTQIDHDVFVSVKEHDGARIVQLVHLVEVGDFGNVDEIHAGEILDLLGRSARKYAKKKLV